jgi:hypothetical protein
VRAQEAYLRLVLRCLSSEVTATDSSSLQRWTLIMVIIRVLLFFCTINIKQRHSCRQKHTDTHTHIETVSPPRAHHFHKKMFTDRIVPPRRLLQRLIFLLSPPPYAALRKGCANSDEAVARSTAFWHKHISRKDTQSNDNSGSTLTVRDSARRLRATRVASMRS